MSNIKTVYILMPVLVFSFLVNPAFAQTQTTTFKDPQGRFSIDYPSDWNATAAKNRFDSDLVTISPPAGFNFTEVLVKIVPAPKGFSTEEALNIVFASLRNSIPNFEMNQDVECTKYTMDGHNACSVIYARTVDYSSTLKFAVMQVSSIISGKLYIIQYESLPDSFDSTLPTIEQMISSFKAS